MGLVLARNHMRQVAAHAERERPFECCGVLLGAPMSASTADAGVVRSVAPATNVADGDRRRRYAIDPRVLFDVHRAAREEASPGDRQVVGYYHSHPADPPIPSVEDAVRAWPRVVYLIVGRIDGRWRARCWRWCSRRGFVEERLEIVDGRDGELAQS